MFKNSLVKIMLIVVLVVVAVFLIAVTLFKTSNNPARLPASFENLTGKSLSDINLYDKDNSVYPLKQLAGKKVVLFFSEGLMCYPACWDQISAFGQDSRFSGDKIWAISVITDTPAQWQRAYDKMPSLRQASILFDRGAEVSKKLGLLNLDSSMHRGMLPGHTYIVLDEQGIVRFSYDDPAMAVRNDMMYNKLQNID